MSSSGQLNRYRFPKQSGMTAEGLPTRRQFVIGGLSAAGATGLGTFGRSASAFAAPSGEYRLKLSVGAQSFNQLFREKKITVVQFIEFCRDMNLEGIELSADFFESDDEAYFRDLKLKCYRLGLDIAGTTTRNNFAQADPQVRRKEIEKVKGWIDRADILGSPVIRVFGGGLSLLPETRFAEGYTERDAFEHVVAAWKECVQHAQRKGVLLAMENHGFPGTAEEMIKVIRAVNNPWFGVCLDTGNFRSRPYEQMEAVAPYIFIVQLKARVVADGPASPGGQGEPPRVPTDLERVNRILKKSGYRGYVSLEHGSQDPFRELPLWIERMRQAFC